MQVDFSNETKRSIGEEFCREANYMNRVHQGLKEGSQSSSYEKSVYNAILRLYSELQINMHPRIIVFDEGQQNEKRIHLHPISFAIPIDNIVTTLPHKSHTFSQVVPGKASTYFNLYNESNFFADMRHSLFSLTYKKGGWDCLRHLEILAAGSLPLFINIGQCPNQTLVTHPKALYKLILELPGLAVRLSAKESNHGMAMHFERLDFDLSMLDKALYSTIASALLHYTRNVLSTHAMAAYVLDTMFRHSKGHLFRAQPKRVLYLSHQDHDMDKGDYLTDLLLHGLKTLLGENAVLDFPRRDALYKSTDEFNTTDYLRRRKGLYGNGFSWGLTLDSFASSSDRDHAVIRGNLESRAYDLVILGSGHRDGWAAKLHFWDLVCKHYNPLEVGWVDGSDQHSSRKLLSRYSACAGHMFSREGFGGG
jgi:hypothetical protein